VGALCLAAGAAATVSDKVAAAGGANATLGLRNYRVAVASFGGEGLSGSLSLTTTTHSSGQAVQWTTSELVVPTQLVQEVCGESAEVQSFTYSINEAWLHPRVLHGQGEACGERYTGGHWDPTAACSSHSRNGACSKCHAVQGGYGCSPESFHAYADASGSHAYRFLNKHACELGDLSGMKGELEALVPEDNTTESVTIPPVASPGGLAQMSAPFGEISAASVAGDTIGVNCDASGPPAVHGINCDCLRYNGKVGEVPSVGSMTVFRPLNVAFYMAGGPGLPQLRGKSVVVQCGSTFGDKAGTPLFCAALQ